MESIVISKDEKIEQLRKAIEQRDDFPKLYFQFAPVLEELGDLENAKAYYTKAIELDPNDSVILDDFAFLFEKLGDQQQAKKNYQHIFVFVFEQEEIKKMKDALWSRRE